MSGEQLKNSSEKLGVQQEFIGAIDALRPGDLQVFDFEQVRHDVLNSGSPKATAELLPTESGVYVTENVHNRLSESGQLPSRASFTVQEGRSVGRDDSRHNVFFGDLSLENFANSESAHFSIAVKPFTGKDGSDEGRPEYLAQELYMQEELKAAGLNGIEVLGFVKTNDGYYLLSTDQPEMVMLDSVNWSMLDDEQRRSVVYRGLTHLAEMHINSLFHGDANPRNIALPPDTSDTWHVDLEHGSKSEDPQRVLMGIRADLSKFYSGLASLQSGRESYGDMVDQVLVPYELVINELKRKGDNPNIEVIEKLYSLLFLEFEREMTGGEVSMNERQYHLGHVGLIETVL